MSCPSTQIKRDLLWIPAVVKSREQGDRNDKEGENGIWCLDLFDYWFLELGSYPSANFIFGITSRARPLVLPA